MEDDDKICVFLKEIFIGVEDIEDEKGKFFFWNDELCDYLIDMLYMCNVLFLGYFVVFLVVKVGN